MTLISKLAISLFISVTSIFILTPPPAPTADDLAVRQPEVFEGYGRPVDIPSTTSTVPVTTPITQPDACQTVFDMARHVGWAEQDLTQLVAIACMVTLKHLFLATVLTAYTYLIMSVTNKRKARDDREHRPEN
jgi:hypothetical protein